MQIAEKSRLIENLNYEKAWGGTFSVVDEGSARRPPPTAAPYLRPSVSWVAPRFPSDSSYWSAWPTRDTASPTKLTAT